jgi:hypothetical protein
LDAEGWELREAVNLAAPGPLAADEPSLDWYAEYERLVPIAGGEEGHDVRLSGHTAGLAEHRSELRGFDATEGDINGRSALWGVGADGKPAVVTIAFDERYTIMALSYALELDDLRRVATQLLPTSQNEWIAHGGKILECLPTDPACKDSQAE